MNQWICPSVVLLELLQGGRGSLPLELRRWPSPGSRGHPMPSGLAADVLCVQVYAAASVRVPQVRCSRPVESSQTAARTAAGPRPWHAAACGAEARARGGRVRS